MKTERKRVDGEEGAITYCITKELLVNLSEAISPDKSSLSMCLFLQPFVPYV